LSLDLLHLDPLHDAQKDPPLEFLMKNGEWYNPFTTPRMRTYGWVFFMMLRTLSISFSNF
jgi:hypothetical protein